MAKEKSKKNATSNITVVTQMKDYSKEPVFVKKAEEAKKWIEEHGLPQSAYKRKK